MDGILGLGPPPTHQQGAFRFPQKKKKSIMQTILSSMQQKLFTVSLLDSQYSHIRFGAIDSSKYSGELIYSRLDSSPLSLALYGPPWEITAAGISISGGAGGKVHKPKSFDANGMMTWFGTVLIHFCIFNSSYYNPSFSEGFMLSFHVTSHFPSCCLLRRRSGTSPFYLRFLQF